MNKADRYLQAGTRDNTRRSYRAAVEHFEVTWGGFLPATGDGIVRYLAEYADQHSISNAWLHWCSGTSPKDFLIPPKPPASGR